MSQKEKIKKLIGTKLFVSKKQLKKFLKDELDIKGDYHPDEFELEENVNALISNKELERKVMTNADGKRRTIIRLGKK